MIGYESFLLTAGGRITCLRCTARSTRTGLQCGRAALKASKTQKCQFHGGRGSGPKTAEGKARIAAARTTHGQQTKEALAAHSAASARLARLEDAMFVLQMTQGERKVGRKARGYVPVVSVDDVRRMVAEDVQLRVKGQAEGGKS
jgi:hypothetical protein